MNKRPIIIVSMLSFIVMLTAIAWAGSNQARLIVPTGDIIFDHQLHVTEMEVECDACHPDIESSALANDKNLPTMENCEDCHDIDDDENCGMCHKDPDDPLDLFNPPRPINFNHQVHLSGGTNCTYCHGSVATTDILTESSMPKMALCMNCHTGRKASSECAVCHGSRLTLTDLHPPDWRHQHGPIASFERDYCLSCHQKESYCVACHQGDNLTRQTHALNYAYTHGLDARSKESRCATCHDTRSFCNDCHTREQQMPLEHSTANWKDKHGLAAVTDIENCVVCHDTPDPTCARSGCHVEGTGHRIHSKDIGRFDSEGEWHEDENYFCFQCHTNTGREGSGFCGYCHD